jgi:hypothetical protein
MPLHETPVRLKSHRTRTGIAIGPAAGMALGGIFFLAGGFVILLSIGVIPSPDDSFNAPRSIVGVCGVIFAAPGLYVILSSIRTLAHRSRATAALALDPFRPWKADHPWQPDGIADAPGTEIPYWAVGGLFLAIFTIPFFAIGWVGGDTVFAIASGVMVLFVIGIFAKVAHLLLRLAKYGKSRLRWGRFPFFLGETLEVDFVNPRGFGRFERLALTLRCIEERFETRQTSDGSTTAVVPYEIYAETAEMTEGGEYNAGDGALPLTFALPAEAPPTRLSKHPPTYWELAVEAETAGVDFATRFLVPVYAKAEIDPLSQED